MKNLMTLLVTTAAVSLASSAFAANEAKVKSNVEYKKDGGYESKMSSDQVTPDGTKKTSETKVDVDVNSKGLVKKTVKTETAVDPKGSMNQEKEIIKSEVKETTDGYEKKESAKVTDAAGTNTSTTVSTDVETDKDGNVIETTKTKKVVDPKGLMNKETTTTKTKIVNGQVVEQKTK